MSKTQTKQGGKVFPALCNIIGTLMLVAVIVTALPLTLPKFFGYEIFHVETGSMGQALPAGSVIYVAETAPEQVKEGDIITFTEAGVIISHRVVQNRVVEGVFRTRGDANPVEDPEPVPYSALIGVVTFHIPVIGAFLAVYASTIGKIYVLLFAASGLMFNLLAGRLRAKRRESLRESLEQEVLSGALFEAEPLVEKKKRRRKGWLLAVVIVLALAFVGSGVTVLVLNGRYKTGQSLYEKTAKEYTTVRPTSPARPQTDPEETGTAPTEPAETAPISVDFAALQAVNPDVIGWIYCPDSPINYPVLQGEDNDAYLHRGYDGNYVYAGSIFLEAQNTPDFLDGNSIIYGHNMKDGTMFNCLEEWADQAYYEAHPTVWLLTPTQDYKINLFSCHLTDARSGCYVTGFADETARAAYIEEAVKASAVSAPPPGEGPLVLLTTCAYQFEEARFVLHGELIEN